MGNLIILLWLSLKFQLFPVPELHPTHPDGNPEDTDQQEGEDHREVHPEQPVLLPGAGQEEQELVRPRAGHSSLMVKYQSRSYLVRHKIFYQDNWCLNVYPGSYLGDAFCTILVRGTFSDFP